MVIYQPTPTETIKGFVELSQLGENTKIRILECSAGNGDLADVFRLNFPNAEIECIEIDSLQCQLLAAKGYTTYEGDFLALRALPKEYDLLLCNPPYNTPNDAEAYKSHIVQAISKLQKNKTLIASMSYDLAFCSDLRAYFPRCQIEVFEDEKTNYNGFGKTKIMFLRVMKL
jgi:16S rRNA G1207 methylase RsmC